MPHINLSALNGQELRQLLDSSRRRGDASLSYKVLQEMAARRDAPAERRPSRARRAAEPRHIEVVPDEPMETDDDLPPMPNWRPPGLEAGDMTSPPPEFESEFEPEPQAPAPPPPLDADRPLSLRDDDPDPSRDGAAYAADPGARFQPVELGVPRQPGRPRFRLLAGLALGAVLGISLGWLGGWLARDAMAPRAAPAAAPIETAALTAAPPPTPMPAPAPPAAEPVGPAAAEPAPGTSPEAATAQEPAESPAAPIPPPQAQVQAQAKTPKVAPIPDGAALELPAPAAVALAPVAPTAVAKGCARQPTPADRAICADPNLRRLQGELRQAYEEALDAHEDRALLRQRQLAWADARNAVTDPARLTRLYAERIRKLRAATAEARRREP